jgi:hypothetical protein
MGSLLFSPAPVSGEAHIGAANPAQFFAGATEITELYAGTTKIWAKPAPVSTVRTGTWDSAGGKLVVSGTQPGSGTYEVDVELWDREGGASTLANVRLGWSGSMPTNPVTSVSPLGGAAMPRPTFDTMVSYIQGMRVNVVIDNSFNVSIVPTGFNPNVPAWKAVPLSKQPNAWLPLDATSKDMSGHNHSVAVRSYAGGGPNFPYGVHGHDCSGGKWLKLNIPADTATFTISAWYIPKTVSHLNESSVVFGSLMYQGGAQGSFEFGEMSLGLSTAPQSPAIRVMYITGLKGVHPGTDATHINRWPQFAVNTAYHIVLRSDSNIWINGEKRLHNQMGTAETLVPPKIIGASGISIGGAKEYQGTMYAGAEGYVASVAYWKRALTDTDIAQIYAAGRAA